MVSLKDIAGVCGVSTATVSKALNNQPDIGPETREKIRRASVTTALMLARSCVLEYLSKEMLK